MDNSDYTKPRTKIQDRLPEVFQSDIAVAVYENLFNRFLTKNETKKIAGYIGEGNPNAVVKRQIQEPTIDRQAAQLQPILNAKVGSEQHISSWKDLQNQLTRLGIDLSKMPQWGSIQEFNWIPPIDIDKLINYQNYYWYDSVTPNSQPDYIVIRNECTQATAYVNFWQQVTSTFGTDFPIIAVGNTPSAEHYNELIVNGNFVQLFTADLIFNIVNSTNTDLNNTTQKVVSSSYDSVAQQTTIVLANEFDINTADGNISLVENLTTAIANRDCICQGTLGWDQQQWDDNPNNPPSPIWGDPPNSQLSLIAAISQPGPPSDISNVPTDSSVEQNLWFDTVSDQLYQYNSVGTYLSVGWHVVANAFSSIIAQTNGNNPWDDSTSCGTSEIVIPAAAQWIVANKWIHKTDVPNFTVAKRAQFPIIEFASTLEMNEWVLTTYNWQYRSNISIQWVDTESKPDLIELVSFGLVSNTTSKFVIDESYGDQTSYFTIGKIFAASNDPFATNTSGPVPVSVLLVRPITVTRSYFVKTSGDEAYRTVVEYISSDPNAILIDTTYRLIPIETSVGDTWKGYNVHWMFEGANSSVPVGHVTQNLLLADVGSTITTVGNYQYTSGPYVQNNILTSNTAVSHFDLSTNSITGSSRPLTERALLGFDDIRVYVNGIRQFGTYNESSTDSVHVTGIDFLVGFIPSAAGTTVRIEVGEGSTQDLGLTSVPVLTSSAIQTISLVEYRKSEQIKTTRNQYPLFDLYNPDGSFAHKATQIFGYEISQTNAVVPALDARIIESSSPTDFNFEQYLIDFDNGNLHAYRDYANLVDSFWVDDKRVVHVWSGFNWDIHFVVIDSSGNSYYTTATSGATQPDSSDFITGNLNYLWYDTSAKELEVRVANTNQPSDFEDVSSVAYLSFDETLQTIWKDGTNDEHYVPAQVDWENRTLDEYNAEQTAYVTMQESQGVSPTDALANWFNSQINPFSLTGEWTGDWQIPDPLYYNNLHENRKIVTYRQLLTHFNSVINAQPTIPGFVGPKSNMFHLLPFQNVNFGLGGKIKEYNDGFDTFLSSIFEDTVNPLTLIDFAHEQYESLLNNLRVIYTQNLLSYLTNVSQDALLDQQTFIDNQIVTNIEENENLALLYGDSSTFNEVTKKGIQNWIDTLVYIKLITKSTPIRLVDKELDIDTLSHHDTHFESYTLPSNVIESTSRLITQQPDNRNGIDKFGRISTSPPPATISIFATSFATSIVNRQGVYWFYALTPDPSTRLLYRLNVVNCGSSAPVTTLPDGSLWIDTGTNTLQQLISSVWTVYPGHTTGDGRISEAWQIVDLSKILNSVVLTVENKLYENGPTVATPYDLNQLPLLDAATYFTYLEQAFLDYVAAQNITAPFKNTTYVASNPFTWNYTYSTVGTGYEIVDTDATAETFIISDPVGLFVAAFATGNTFYVKNSESLNDGTWVVAAPGATWDSSSKRTTIPVLFSSTKNVVANTFGILYQGDLLPSNVNTGSESAGHWQALYQAFYNTPYPHLEPWKLQGYYDKPLWWDTAYGSSPTAWPTSMWSKIAVGVIPAGETYPNGVVSVSGIPSTDRASPILLDVPDLPIYHYFSVNITNSSITGLDGITYAPNALFPPYWAGPTTPTVRSLFTSVDEIISPSSDFIFGSPGPIEWQWRSSSQFLYDQLKIAFRMDPVRFISHTFGKKFLIVDDLQIDSDTNNTFSHTRTNFHGDVVDNQQYTIDGLNQWYVDYNRYSDIDSSYSDFRILWTGWTAPMTYQLSSFVDVDSFILGHRTVPVSTFDWTITSKHSSGVSDFWLDAFNISVIQVPPAIARYNNEKQWGFEIDTNLSVSRTLSYYDVQNYQFYNLYTVNNGLKVPSNTFSIYTYPIIAVDTVNNTFSVDSDQTDAINANQTFTVMDSTSNNGTFTVVSAAYDQLSDTTIVGVSGIVNAVNGIQLFGKLKLNYRTLSWQTGDMIYLTTDEVSPSPVSDENFYFVIMISDTEFQLAFTQQDALSNTPITIETVGRRNQYIGKIQATFVALGGQNTNDVWKHYLIDKTNVLTLTTPYDMTGVQRLVNIVDGYSSYTYDQGWRVNSTGQLVDPVLTTRTESWQLEVERFINYIYGARVIRNAPPGNSFPISVDVTTSEFQYTAEPGQFVTGDVVNIVSEHFKFPPPLLANIKYYIIVDTLTTFRLAGTQLDALKGNAIALENIAFVGNLSIIPAPSVSSALLTFEINPFREGIWFRPPEGIIANIFEGPSDDLRTTQLVFDQYGRPFSSSNARVVRSDKETQIIIARDIPNDVVLSPLLQTPYNLIHLGGLHLFVDTFENVVVFNDYTTNGNLLYDPFVGLNVTKFELQFLRQLQFTERPNVGGFFLSSFFNQNPSLTRNIEANIEDLRYAYDTYKVVETDPIVQYSRKALGYEGLTDYLNALNLDQKAQFVFWRGLIHQKGSVNAINAFTNSRRFDDAVVDEFWAIKLANFGSSAEKIYPELFLTTQDARSNDVRLDFVTPDDLCYPGYAINVYDQLPCGYSFPSNGGPILIGENGFTPILLSDQTRWHNQPDQQAALDPDGGTMYFNMKVVGKDQIGFASSLPVSGTEGNSVIVSSGGNHIFYTWTNGVWIKNGSWDDTTTDNTHIPYIRHGFKADAIQITLSLYSKDKVAIVTGTIGNILTLPVGSEYLPFTSGIQLFKKSGSTTTALESGIDYAEVLDTGGALLSNQIYFPTALISGDEITVTYQTSTLVEDLHYSIINSDIVSFLFKEIVDGITITSAMNLSIWGLIEDNNSQNPAKIIDVISQVVLTPVQIWDPARGMNYSSSVYNIDLFDNGDPATYTNTPIVQSPPTFTRDQFWSTNNVSDTWLDTSTVQYYRYYDTNAEPVLETRFAGWGNLADWASAKVYEWVQSDVTPDQWNALAEVQENDITILESQRKAGRVFQRLFRTNDGNPKTGANHWIRYVTQVQELDVVIEGEPQPSTGTIVSYNFKVDQTKLQTASVSVGINVYKNGRLLVTNTMPTLSGSDLIINLTTTQVAITDHLTFVITPPTDTTVIAAGVTANTLLQSYEYTQVPFFDSLGNQQFTYYFWVQDKITRGNSNRTLSPSDTQNDFVTIPVPYMFFQNVKDPATVIVNNFPVNLPLRYTQCIIRGLRGLINDNMRYIIRYTRDFTLRDSLDHGKTPLALKNQHQQWELIRPNQNGKIRRALWDDITESIVGFNLTNTTIRVPSLTRQLYDTTYGTDTQYGFGLDQAFANGTLALGAIEDYLQDNSNDFLPIDINLFFEQNSFDTAANIIIAMNAIYTTFADVHVNKMFFSVLQNAAMTQKYQYPGILKTSMISVTGVTTLETSNLFDD